MPSRRVAVIGGGISGLSLAWRLHFHNTVTLFEKSDRCGGWIRTETVDEFLFERGPRSCRTRGNGGATLRLIHELGLDDQVIYPQKSANKRFIYNGKRLRNFSALMLKSLPSLLIEWLRAPSQLEDESVYSCIQRRLGTHAAEWLFDPLTKGIYAGDSRQLSMRSCFPDLHNDEREHGSFLKGMWKRRKNMRPSKPLFSLRKGMGQLVDTLVDRLANVIDIKSEITSIRQVSNAIELTVNGKTQTFDQVYTTVQPHLLAPLIHPVECPVFESADVTLVNIGYSGKVLPVEGFGYLVPGCLQEEVLGTVFDSSVFTEHQRHPDQTRLTVMIKGAHPHPEEIALNALSRHLGITASPAVISPFCAIQSIPQFHVGHQGKVNELIAEVQKRYPSLTVLGSAFYGVSVNDCIAHAEVICSACNSAC